MATGVVSSAGGRGFLDRYFKVAEHGSTVSTEILGGVTTFMVMAYIIFVNPTILGLEGKGLPFAAAMTSTCVVAGIMTIAMGLYTNRAFAIAPGMGLNAVVTFQLVVAMGLSWPAAMGVIVLEGLAITILVLTGFRQAVMEAIPLALKQAIAVGIGWFILFIGLVEAGIVVPGPPGVPVTLGKLVGWPVLVAAIGIAITFFLMARKVRGGLLWGILLTTAIATIFNYLSGLSAFTTPGVARIPESTMAGPDFSLFGQFDFSVFAKVGLISGVMVIFSIMLSDFFDTMGTLVGVGGQAGYLNDNGEMPEVRKPLLVDSLAAVVGGGLSSSSATTYIESAAGIAAGARTGLAAVVVGILFLLALPFSPIVGMVPKEATAAALIVVGYLMMTALSSAQATAEEGQSQGLNFNLLGVGLPAIVTMAVMPLTYSITNGIGAGFLTYTAIQIFQGRSRQVHWMLWVASAAFLLYFAKDWLNAAFGI